MKLHIAHLLSFHIAYKIDITERISIFSHFIKNVICISLFCLSREKIYINLIEKNVIIKTFLFPIEYFTQNNRTVHNVLSLFKIGINDWTVSFVLITLGLYCALQVYLLRED